MSDSFLTNAAISQGNALTNEALEHNDAVKARNQEILSQVTREKNNLDGQKSSDKLFHDISDTYSIGGALKSSYNTYAEAQKVGGFKNYVAGEGGIGTLKKRANTVKNFVNNKINPQETPKPESTPLKDSANTNGTTADKPPLSDAPQPTEEPPPPKPTPEPAPAAKSGTAASTAGGEAESIASKTPSSTSELLESARNTAGKAGDALGVVGTGMGVVAGGQALTEDIMAGKIEGDNTANKVSNVASIAAGALDVASIFLPVLAPVAAIASATAAVSGGVGEIEDIADKENKDASDANAMKGTTKDAVDLAAGGMVASTSTDTTKSISATGSF